MHDLRKCLWYRRPAESWIEGLPIGNGRLGAMIEGGVNRDHMYFNEESLWGGKPEECERTDAEKAMKELQKRLFAGEYQGIEELVMRDIMPEKRWFGSYQVFGEAEIRFFKTMEYDTYQRRLNLDEAIIEARMATEKNGEHRRKEYFASAPRQVIAIRYETTEKEGMDLEVSLSRVRDATVSNPLKGCLLMEGRCGQDGIQFAGMLMAVPEGGTVETIQIRPNANPVLVIKGARKVDFFISARTDLRCPNYRMWCEEDVRRAVEAGYERIRQEHIEDYKRYYERFDLGLGSEKEDLTGLTTWERLQRIKEGKTDEDFYALFVHYQRYLLLSSSRPGCLPSNLQGLWNYQTAAPWESDYHTNVNLQINYWPSEGYQLGECHTALFDWLERVAASGAKTARNYYGAAGWTLHHASNVFAHTAPCAVPAGLWPMGGAWIVRHLYEHFLYTGDLDFLEKQAYPLMKGAAEFLLDFLLEAPKGTRGEGYLVTNPSHSPENRFLTPDGNMTTFTYGATMDFQIIRDLFGNCMEAVTYLRKNHAASFEESFVRRLKETLKRIPPLCISERTGGIQEWIDDYEEADPGHRHLSHLYGLYPAREIDAARTPGLAEAAKRTLNRKLEHGYDGQGWSCGWMSCLWARLEEPEAAYEALKKILERHTQHNLFLEAHGNPQVGDAQAVPAAILEMLVQFDGEKLWLLPALPKAWGCGWVKGLKTPGGYVLDMNWEHGYVKNLTVHKETAFCSYPIVYKRKEEGSEYDGWAEYEQ